MNVVKHTPGPWSVESTTGPDIYRKEIVAGDDRSVLAEVFGDDLDDQCWPISANARLIAAAPELLAACKAAHAMFCDAMFIWGKDDDKKVGHMTKAIAQAIAKAEGSL